MRKNIITIGIFLMLALAAAVWAADISGKWVAQAQGSDITLIFKVDGATLTGTLDNSQMPGAIEIKEGKIDGNNVSFIVVRKMGEMEMKINWKGTIAGDEIKFKRESAGGGGGMMGGPGGGGGGGGQAEEIIAKRAK
jgi:hypothetical protein